MFREGVGKEYYLHHELACGPMQGIPSLTPHRLVDPVPGQPDPAQAPLGSSSGQAQPLLLAELPRERPCYAGISVYPG